jgi:thioesterase domain-containing protein
MRGLMNIFSLGMDQLASAIHQHGIETAVYNHAQADRVVDEIAQRYRGGDHGPIILIGHSLAADAVMQMAQIARPQRCADRAGHSVRRHRLLCGTEERGLRA